MNHQQNNNERRHNDDDDERTALLLPSSSLLPRYDRDGDYHDDDDDDTHQQRLSHQLHHYHVSSSSSAPSSSSFTIAEKLQKSAAALFVSSNTPTCHDPDGHNGNRRQDVSDDNSHYQNRNRKKTLHMLVTVMSVLGPVILFVGLVTRVVTSTTTTTHRSSSTNPASSSSSIIPPELEQQQPQQHFVSIDELVDHWEGFKRKAMHELLRDGGDKIMDGDGSGFDFDGWWQKARTKSSEVLDAARDKEKALANTTGEWTAGTKSWLHDRGQDASKVWDNTKHKSHDVWDATVDKEHDIADNSKQWLRHRGDDVSKVWNATKKQRDHIKQATHGAAGAWNDTTRKTHDAWDATVKKEHELADKTHNTWDATVKKEHKLADKSQHWFRDRGANVVDAWNATKSTSQHAATATRDWFTGRSEDWNTTRQHARAFFHQLRDRERHLGQKTRSWWNHTITNEQEWWDHAMTHLGTFGHRVGSWWNTSTSWTSDKEHILEDKFQHWWRTSRAAEKRWWNETRDAFHVFATNAQDKEQLWWNMTRHAVGNGWNRTRSTEQAWWDATALWFRNHQRQGGKELGSGVTDELLYLNTSKAFSYLMNSYGWFDYSADYWFLATGLDAQINQAYCAVATAAAVLNSYRPMITEQLPVDADYEPYHYATQRSLLDNDCVKTHVVHKHGIFRPPGGLSMGQTAKLLQCHLVSPLNASVGKWTVTAHHVDPAAMTMDDMRKDLEQALIRPTARVLINYDREALGQAGGGHFSPVASYSTSRDSFLVVDVAKYKYPPVWVPTSRMYETLSTPDLCGKWDWPQAQDELVDGRKLPVQDVNSTEEMHRVAHQLHCRPTYRGYLIVDYVISS